MFRRIVFPDSRVPGCGGIEADAGACGAFVEVVHRLFVDAGVVLGIFGFVFVDQYKDSFLYLGGMHGYNVSNWLVSQVGVPGVWLLLLVTAICFLIYLSARTVIWLRRLFSLSFLKRKEKAESVQGETPEEFKTSWGAKEKTTAPTPEAAEPEKVLEKEEEVATEEEEDEPLNEITLDLGGSDGKVKPAKSADEDVTMTFETPAPEPVPPFREQPVEKEPAFQVEKAEEEEYVGTEKEPYNPRLDLENYHYPTIDLMKHYDDNGPTIDMVEQNANKDKIINTLRSFGIEISTIKATVGPTVTLYEITPEQGVRISKIRGLEDDIALSLSALGIRIIAPIPGRVRLVSKCPTPIRRLYPVRVLSAARSSRSLLTTCPSHWVRRLRMKCLWWICARCRTCSLPVLPVRVSPWG